MIADPVRCQELVELVTEWLEGGLPEDRRAEVEEHLAICPDCVGYVDQIRATTHLLRRLHDETDGSVEPARRRLMAAFRQWTA